MARNDLELWRVTDHEGLAIPRRVECGRMPPVDELAPGDYVLCDAGGNLLTISVRDDTENRPETIERRLLAEEGVSDPPF